jgi:hypothetical protein
MQDGGAIDLNDFYKTAYNLGDTLNFYKLQTPKFCPKNPDIPSVFVRDNIS